MLNVTYMNSATNQTYNPYALTWISSEVQKRVILDTASKLGVSAAAIAGAMAEECTSIRANPVEFAKQTWIDEVALRHNMGLGSYRTHKEFNPNPQNWWFEMA